MAYLAIARKWRPTRFEDLIGQEHVVQTLRNAISLDRISHAYLFSGARGIGKTTVARIFAKALRCPNQKEGIPCNACSECQLIGEGRSVDVSEIDGASHNGVEAVRSIRDNVSYAPSAGNYKVYIIDEVHMLSLSAFNALLKTLEEPPPHVVFIFATTEVQKIPLTILSRCQRFEFRRLTQTQIVERLKQILEAEKITATEPGLRTIASYADGSLRDALSLLDQILSHQGASSALDEKVITQGLGVASSNTITEWIRAILEHRTKDALDHLNQAYQAGVDLKHFAERGLEELRLIYLMVVAKESLDAGALDISPSQFQTLTQLAAKSKRVEIERMAQILSKSISQMGNSSLPRFVLEMASVRMGMLEDLSRVEEFILQGKLQAKPQAVQRPLAASAPAAPPVQPVTAPVSRPAAEPRPLGPPPRPTARNSGNPVEAFIDFAMKKRPLLGALLGHAEFQITPDKKVNLKFEEGSFFQRQASEPPTRQALEEMARLFFGPESSLSLTSGGAGEVRSMERSRIEETEAIKKSALEHPAVLQAKEVLGAEVINVQVDL